MKNYKVKFCITDAIGTYHEIYCGEVQANSDAEALAKCSLKFGKAENTAFYMVAEVGA